MGATDRQVGVTAVVNTKAEGKPPSGDQRTLASGTKMYFEEKVVTNGTGRAQLLFADGSSMTIGPNSDLVIDTFIYNPDTKVGDMTVSLTKGFVRFVGGRISKKRAVKFKTPIGSIGIRGGIALVEMRPASGLVVDFLFGQEVTVVVDGVTQTTTTPGTFVSVSGEGQAPSAPERRESSDLNQRLRTFESQGSSESDSSESGGQQANNNQGGDQQQGQQSGGSQQNQQSDGDQKTGGTGGDAQASSTEGGASGQGGTGGGTDQAGTGQAGTGALGGGGLGGGGISEQINIGLATLADDPKGGLSGDIGSGAPGGGPAGKSQGGPGSKKGGPGFKKGGGDTQLAVNLNQVLKPLRPPPQGQQPNTVVVLIPKPRLTPTPTPAEVEPERTPEPTVGSTRGPAPTITVETPSERETTSAPTGSTAFSRSFGGFALRGTASFATLGANTTLSSATLKNRRFSSVTVSGADDTVGGRLTASSRDGDYGIFYPAPTASSPTNLSSCPSRFDCTVQIAGVTPNTTTGPIDHAADPNFVTYALNVESEKALIVVGTEFTGSTPTTGATKYAIRADSFLASDLPFVRSSDSGFTNAGNDTEAYVNWSPSAISKPFMASSFEIDQTNGKSSISVVVGRIHGASNPYFEGFGYGQVDQTGTATPTLYVGGAYSADTASGKDFFGAVDPAHFVLTSVEDADTGGWLAGTQDVAGGTPYYPTNVVSFQGAHTVDASNTKLVGASLTGYYGGAGTLAATPGAYVATATNGDTAFLSINASNELLSTAFLDFSADGGMNTITADIAGGVGAYIDDDHFGVQLKSGGTTGGGTEAVAKGYLVTGGSNSGGFDLCSTCEYLTWGFWGQQQVNNQVVMHMASWVAGVATDFGTLGALTASGTYNGKVVGSIIDSSATLVKTGTFSLDVSLAGSASTATLSSFSFNGDSFSTGATSFAATSQHFALTNTAGGRTLDMRGAFFGTDGANIPPEVGGDFKINGTGYNAAGVFAGKKVSIR